MNILNDKGGRLHLELPAGVADILPEAAERFIELRRTILITMAGWGYRPVQPLLLDHAEALARALPDSDEEVSFYKMVDRLSGRVLSLRADFTPQLARIAATRFAEAALPLRFFYEGPVVRHVPNLKGKRRELHQAGAELMGVMDPEGDSETIAMMVDCLRASGLEDFKVDVGQVEFFKGIFKDVELTPEALYAITDAVKRKDLSDLENALENAPISVAKKELLSALPLLAGGSEVLDRASALAESDHSKEALSNLSDALAFVDKHGLGAYLTVDLGEIRGVDYYTGIIFEGFVHHVGTPLSRGGRYDGLVGAYGKTLPATGFSIDILSVAEALSLQNQGARPTRSGVFIINFLDKRDEAIKLARTLRAEGVRASRDLVKRPLDESVAAAAEQNFAFAIALGAEGTPSGEALLIDLQKGERRSAAIEELTGCLQNI